MDLKEAGNLTLAAYESIKDMMFNYDLVPGQRLVFVDLAKQLGVSRTPVNNALSILAKEGYLDFVPHQGYKVHKLTLEELESLYEIREILELGTIGKAIRQMTEGDLALLESKKKEYKQSVTNQVQRKQFILDTEFHATIINILGNQILVERYRDLCQKIFLRFRIEDLRITRINEIVEEHNEFFEAVRMRDVERAKELIRKHNQHARQNLLAHIFKDEPRSNGLLQNGQSLNG